MKLVKLEDFFPHYSAEVTPGYDITDFEVIAKGDKKVGSVATLLVDEDSEGAERSPEGGRFRYFVIDLGLGIFGKKVLLPIGLGLVIGVDRRVYVEQLTQEQFKTLPEYHENRLSDYAYIAQLEASDRQLLATIHSAKPNNSPTFSYEQEPDFYELKDPYLQHYQEQLIAKKQPQL